MDDILKRLSNVEASVSEVRVQVSAISATIPHLATAATVSEVRSQVSSILAIIPHLATKADVADVGGNLASLETAIVK